MKKLKELAPHEREVLENELKGIQIVCKQLEESGLTPEKAEQMSTEEFANYFIKHDIKV